MHVFIVDDSAWVRSRLVELLKDVGGVHVVGEAGTVDDAIVGILRTRPDSVLLDLDLVGKSGLSVLRAIRPQAPDIAFVILTNHSEPQYRAACAQAGACYFLDKCTELDRIGPVISELAASAPYDRKQ